MFTSLRSKLFDSGQPGTFVSTLRARRLDLFRRMVRALPPPVRVLDVGGRPGFWTAAGWDEPDAELTFLNLDRQIAADCPHRVILGDARNMSMIDDNAFDIAFSNSVIEHVGGYDDQMAMAKEVRRVAPRYYVQTPNYRFPIEPHYLFPGFQWLPIEARVFLLSHFRLGYLPGKLTPEKARSLVQTTQLLTKERLLALFPDAALEEEKLFGLTKSLVVYKGELTPPQPAPKPDKPH